MTHQVDTNDLEHVMRLGYEPKGWSPGALRKNGGIHPNVTKFWLGENKYLTVAHIKVVYYETAWGTWRPLGEICEYHGNKTLKLNDKWRQASIRYINWLTKRQERMGRELLLPTPFGEWHFQELARPILNIGMTTTTVYPHEDGAGGATTMDAHYEHNTNPFSTSHGATSCLSTNDSATASANDCLTGGGNFRINRHAFLFDTSSIGASDTIDSATFSTYQTAVLDSENDGYDYQSVVQTQGSALSSDTSSSVNDYNDIGDAVQNPTEGINSGDRYFFTSGNNNSYNDFSLNSTGLGWIARSGETKTGTAGITYLGTRLGHDIEYQQPGALNRVTQRMADYAATTYDPKLVVEHTAGAASTRNVLFMGGGI